LVRKANIYQCSWETCDAGKLKERNIVGVLLRRRRGIGVVRSVEGI
jgi:hypothetical protein